MNAGRAGYAYTVSVPSDRFDLNRASLVEAVLGTARATQVDDEEDVGVTGAHRRSPLEAHRRMLEIRAFEDEVARLFLQNLVRGSTHLYQGQEAVAVGACFALRNGDTMTCTYRGHGAVLAMGAAADRSLGEILGKADGLCGGKGGSMHLTDVARGALGSFAIVGAHLPFACGAALTASYRGTGAVSLTFFGDGATNIGAFHEAMNLAAIWRLPVVFLCENNLYGEYSPIATTTPLTRLADRAAGYAMASASIDGNDVVAVHEATSVAVDRARGTARDPHCSKPSPTASVVTPARTPAHIGPTVSWTVGSSATRCSCLRWRWGPRDSRRLRTWPRCEMTYSDGSRRSPSGSSVGRILRPSRDYGTWSRDLADPYGVMLVSSLTYREAIAAALADAMDEDPDVLCIGEDIGAAGGVFKTTEGLFERFGPERMRDTPISEQAIVGAALGAAVTGLRPVAELMFADFAGVAFDQIANQVAKYRYMSGGQADVPLTIRMASGAGLGFGAQHSQTTENWFLNVPGLHIAVPSTPAAAYGLMRTAIRSDDPVLVFEHKALFADRGEVERDVEVPLGAAEIVRPGSDVTVVATQLMVQRSMHAADALASEGIEVEVVDPRTLAPLDLDSIAASVARTGRLVCVQESPPAGGWGATVIAAIARTMFRRPRRAAVDRRERRDPDSLRRGAGSQMDAHTRTHRRRGAPLDRALTHTDRREETMLVYLEFISRRPANRAARVPCRRGRRADRLGG